MSRYVIPRDCFTRPSPALVLQATNAGARRPGYEASGNLHVSVTESTALPNGVDETAV